MLTLSRWCLYGLVVAWLSFTSANVTRGAEPGDGLSPAELADRIEAAMEAYRSVDFEAEYEDLKDPTRKKDWITVPGKFRFRSDGARFYTEADSFSIRFGTKEMSRRQWTGGFDGFRNHRSEKEYVYLGEESTAGKQKSAVDVIFGTDNDASYVLRNIRTRECRFLEPVEREGVRCLVIDTVLRRGDNVYRSVHTIAPDRGWLPLKSERYSKDRLLISKSLSKLRQMDGVWVPLQIDISRETSPIPYSKRELRITRFERRADFDDAEFEPRIGPGNTVFDRQAGYPWHADPWWQELGPWMKAEFGWPMRDMRPLHDVASYTGKPDGKPAPPIEPAEWINGDPGPWSRPGRKVTILFFFGGRSINPTPEWMGAMRRLNDEFRGTGLDVIGIATADDHLQSKRVRQTVRELGVDFPVAIDQASESGSYGKTFHEYGLPTYMGVLLVDHEGIVHTLPQKRGGGDPWKTPSPLQTLAEDLLTKAGVEELPEFVLYDEERLYQNSKQITRRWRQLAKASNQDGVISGRVTNNSGAFRDVAVQIQPKLILVSSNTGRGFLHIPDRQRTQKTTTDANGQYRFENLPKGYYEIVVTAPGRAQVKQNLAVDPSFTPVTFDVPLIQGDSIRGRVVDADGEPVVGITVTQVGRHVNDKDARQLTRSFPLPTAVTGTDGSFVLSKLQGGSYALEVEHGNTGRTRLNFVAAGSTNAVIRLPDPNQPKTPGDEPKVPLFDPEALVSALIIDAETRKPIPVARVVAGSDVGGRRAAFWHESSIREARNGRLQWKKKGSYRSFKLRFEADGYVPFVTDWISKDRPRRQFLVRMKKDTGLTGQVVAPDGKPAAGAVIVMMLAHHTAQLADGRLVTPNPAQAESLEDRWRIPLRVEADDQGRFQLPTEVSPAGVYVVHESGVADLLYKDVSQNPEIRLQPWATLDGRVLWVDQPGRNEPLIVSLLREGRYFAGRVRISQTYQSGDDGRFRIRHIPPGRIQVSRVFDLPDGNGKHLFPRVVTEAKPGTAQKVVLGGRGQSVTGKLTGLKSFDKVTLTLSPWRPLPAFDFGGRKLLQESPIGSKYFRDAITVQEDGTFRIDHVLSGRYELTVVRDGDFLIHSTRLTVPNLPGGESADVLDMEQIDIDGF